MLQLCSFHSPVHIYDKPSLPPLLILLMLPSSSERTGVVGNAGSPSSETRWGRGGDDCCHVSLVKAEDAIVKSNGG